MEHNDVPGVVHTGTIGDCYDDTGINASFPVEPAVLEDEYMDIASKFQDMVDNESNGFSLDGSGSGDEKGWSFGFNPCNLLDDAEDLAEANGIVLALATRYRDYMRNAGIQCGEVTLTTTEA